MKRIALLSVFALTTAITVTAPTVEAAPFRFGLSQGQSQLNLDPQGSFSKAVDADASSQTVEANTKNSFFKFKKKKFFFHHY